MESFIGGELGTIFIFIERDHFGFASDLKPVKQK
jgi:hypothetical protein